MVATAHEATDVETVEDATKPIPEPESAWGIRILGRTSWRGKFGTVADVKDAANTSGVEQDVLAACRLSEFSRAI